jgi:hypothetical protein
MKLQTKLCIEKKTQNLINYTSKVVLLGSCFSENIGDKLSYYKFQTKQNPFGILFHPKAIHNLIKKAIYQDVYTASDLTYNNERWHSFDAHSSMSAAEKSNVINTLNSALIETKIQLAQATHVIITLGTSWVYRHLETKAVVANCHKVSQKKFSKELLTIAEISQTLQEILKLLKKVNSEVIVLFTISPVRHLKDGFVENMRSKAHLIAAMHQIIDLETKTSYFPAYEIIMDELRDYRFYNEDMMHPNKIAINYIWEKFVALWFCKTTESTMQEIASIQKGISHRPFDKNSEQHQKFLKNLDLKKKKIRKKYPNILF